MPVIAALIQCDLCGTVTKKAQPFAVMRGGKIACEDCAERQPNSVYMYVSPKLNVETTTKSTQLGDFPDASPDDKGEE